MNKTISKVIMVRSRLKNIYVKNMSEENKRHTRQKNYGVKLFKLLTLIQKTLLISKPFDKP